MPQPQPKMVPKTAGYTGEERRNFKDEEMRDRWSDEERQDFHRNYKRMKPYMAKFAAERDTEREETRKKKSKTHLLPLLDD